MCVCGCGWVGGWVGGWVLVCVSCANERAAKSSASLELSPALLRVA